MPLTEEQANRVWEDALAAEIRSLYFAELDARFTRHNQVITGISFFLASGAAATIETKLPSWVPVLLAAVMAIMMAYSIAVGLDRKSAAMAKLHYIWSQLETGYRHLWNHWYEDNADDVLRDLQVRDREASQLAITEAPYNEKLILKWESFVYKQQGLTAA